MSLLRQQSVLRDTPLPERVSLHAARRNALCPSGTASPSPSRSRSLTPGADRSARRALVGALPLSALGTDTTTAAQSVHSASSAQSRVVPGKSPESSLSAAAPRRG
ncbi:hypothetical protein GGF32_005099 [Allomyces javanicus]|nr:hypothetical protein GGF32_005099 [Allomyces javanicus]